MTPIGRYGRVLSSVRADDLAAKPVTAFHTRNSFVCWDDLDEAIPGAPTRRGRTSATRPAWPHCCPRCRTIPAHTVNRLCASGMDAVISGFHQIRSSEADLFIAGGSESMRRALLVMPKAETAFSRNVTIHDTTIGWRFVRPGIEVAFGIDSMPETAENVAEDFQVGRQNQDRFALSGQDRAARATASGRLVQKTTTVDIHLA